MSLRFKPGDRVVVAGLGRAAGLYDGRVGVIGDVNEYERAPYPYEVFFDSGGSLCFTEEELIHEAEALLATADLSSVKKLDSGGHDAVNHPSHYTWLPNGLEVIDITRHFGFVRGNALKYLFRADFKGRTTEDLKKARWYIDYEIKQLEAKESQ